MTDGVLVCRDERRRDAVRDRDLVGLDSVEVGADHRSLSVDFLGRAPDPLEAGNFRLEGGTRRHPAIVDIDVTRQSVPELDDCVTLTLDGPGDFSCYTLRLVGIRRVDPRYATAPVSFAANCASDLDCKPVDLCPPRTFDEPDIDYLAKDYASFRRLILDRLALIMPDWQERHVPDLGIALVEVLAYAGDHLSYKQDAVATEAYLDTARRRISVRRHARLVDHHLHEGGNARAWITMWTSGDQTLAADEVFFVAVAADAPPQDRVLREEDLRAGWIVFEPVAAPGDKLELRTAHNEIRLHTWGDAQCCLVRGATRATLANPDGELRLRVGDVLILEEVMGPRTGVRADADPEHRHPVRLTSVADGVDPVGDVRVVEIEWAEEDALPFPLCLSSLGPAPECRLLTDVSIARGNVVLVDHGRRLPPGDVGTVPLGTERAGCAEEGRPDDPVPVPGRFRVVLRSTPLTFAGPETWTAAADAVRSAAEARATVPSIDLTSTVKGDEDGSRWTAQRDLLASGPDDAHYVVEIDDEGLAHLRFGDGEAGRMPQPGARFSAEYRIGNGAAGNVGAETIVRIGLRRTSLSGVTLRPRNPLPAAGGVEPESLADARLLAPHAFRRELVRAVTADDYARLAERDRRVQRAAATLRWSGSWYDADVAVDPKGGANGALAADVERALRRYRRMGHDLRVSPAVPVALNIAMRVCVHPDFIRGQVKRALIDLFSNRVLGGERRGLFHPDELTFGEGVYASTLVAAALAVPGVTDATVTTLERLFEGPRGELEAGTLVLGPLEVPRVDSDPSLPEHGRIVFDVRGGR